MGTKSPVKQKWDGIATAIAILGLSGVSIAMVVQGYPCRFVSFIVIGIAGLGGFTYRQYLKGKESKNE